MAAVAASWLRCSPNRRQGCRPQGNDRLQVADLGGPQLQSAGCRRPPFHWAGHSKCCAHVSWWCRAAGSCSKGYHKGWHMGCGQSVGPVQKTTSMTSDWHIIIPLVSMLFSHTCVAHKTSEGIFKSYIYAADGLPSQHGLFILSCNWYTVQGECSFMHAHVKLVTKKRCVNLSRQQQGCAMYRHPQAPVQTSTHTLRTYLLLHKFQAQEAYLYIQA